MPVTQDPGSPFAYAPPRTAPPEHSLFGIRLHRTGPFTSPIPVDAPRPYRTAARDTDL